MIRVDMSWCHARLYKTVAYRESIQGRLVPLTCTTVRAVTPQVDTNACGPMMLDGAAVCRLPQLHASGCELV